MPPCPHHHPHPCTCPPNSTYPTYTHPPTPPYHHLIDPPCTPSAALARLSDAIYTHLDRSTHPAHTGWLEPEKCSRLMDLLGYRAGENTYRTLSAAGRGADWCDGEVEAVYKLYGWEYVLAPRPGSHLPAGVQGGMPLLSRTGLLAMLLQEAMCDPGDFARRVSYLLESVVPPLVDEGGGGGRFGAVPRGALPDGAEPGALWKAEVVRGERMKRMWEGGANVLVEEGQGQGWQGQGGQWADAQAQGQGQPGPWRESQWGGGR